MNKYVLFAALLGLAAATPEVESYTNKLTPRTILDVTNVAKVTYFYDMDVAYTGIFDQGPVSGKPELYFAEIGVKLYSLIRVQFDITLANMYKYTVNMKCTPFSVTPIKLTTRFVRPEAVAAGTHPFDINIKGSHSVSLLQHKVYTTTNMALPKRSFVDWFIAALNGQSYMPIPTSFADFVYNPLPVEYDDVSMSFDFATLNT